MKAGAGVVQERNYGVDLLRIIAMYMVCMIHINLFTEAHVPDKIIPGKEYFFYVGTWTESVGYIGVNLYALITGYVCLNSRWRLSRYLELWALVAFYSLGLLALGMALSCYGILPWEMSWKGIAKIVLKLPVGSTYWYFSAYTALFLVIPFLNKLLQSLSQREFILLLGAVLLLLPCANVLQSSTMYAAGYNVTWLAVLYAAGAYIRRFSPQVHPGLAGGVAFACTLQPLLCRCLHVPAHLSYCSPVMVVYAVSLFLLMYRVRIENSAVRRLIMWAAPLSFGVYIIHVHPWCWTMLCRYGRELNTSLDYPWWIAIVGGAVLYVFCTIVDWVRSKLFALCRVRVLAERVGRWAENIVVLLLPRLYKSHQE